MDFPKIDISNKDLEFKEDIWEEAHKKWKQLGMIGFADRQTAFMQGFYCGMLEERKKPLKERLENRAEKLLIDVEKWENGELGQSEEHARVVKKT